MKKWILILFSNVMAFSALAQQEASETVEMADALRASGKIYVVVLVVLVILTGLILYLIKLDKKVSRLEKDFADKIKS
jgi:Ni,Fe-hydrogenase I cytochrome b subunit